MALGVHSLEKPTTGWSLLWTKCIPSILFGNSCWYFHPLNAEVFQEVSFLLVLDRNVARVSLLFHECYMHCSSHPLSFLSFPSACVSRLLLQKSPQYFVFLGLCACLGLSLFFGVSCVKCASIEQSLGMVTRPTQAYKRMMYYVHSVRATCFFQYCGHPQRGGLQRMCHKSVWASAQM